ncbi:MAG TPA: helix-turn-helix domain-containing protein [Candidatus Limnocylindrales bacterium]
MVLQRTSQPCQVSDRGVPIARIASVDVVRLARSVRILRRRRRWRQEDLAAVARMSRSAIARLEQGRGDHLTIATLERVAASLDARFVWRIDWRGEALDRLLDERHAALVEAVVARLTSWGWLCAAEVSFSVYGERGSIDILAFHPGTAALLVVEVKTAIGDSQATLMTLDRKARLAPRVATERGWDPRQVARLLVLPDESTPRRQIGRLASTYATAFPVRGRELTSWLRRPKRRAVAGIWFLSLGRQAVAGGGSWAGGNGARPKGAVSRPPEVRMPGNRRSPDRVRSG